MPGVAILPVSRWILYTRLLIHVPRVCWFNPCITSSSPSLFVSPYSARENGDRVPEHRIAFRPSWGVPNIRFALAERNVILDEGSVNLAIANDLIAHSVRNRPLA